MKINAAGIAIIKESEGLRLKAYRCPAGVWTIGYGSTGHDVYEGLEITADEAEARLSAAIERLAAFISNLVPIGISDNMFSALCSFVYNVGQAAFKKSTMLKLILAGEPAAAADQFDRWVYAGGEKLPGLVTRRAREKKLFLTPDEVTA